jgi:hypothetical protein
LRNNCSSVIIRAFSVYGLSSHPKIYYEIT